ncbi:MAG: glycosyltransferase, partial [Desulfovibrionaceae bacterium]|nr:glycosyltransferase [Desulfovibrionaceae bacterium]
MKKKSEAPFTPVASLAVIVPTLNEQAGLGACLDSVAFAQRGLERPLEIVVADGGSTDQTASIAAARGAAVIAAPRGRGTQIRAGIDACGADCLLILHADCRLDPDCPAKIL